MDLTLILILVGSLLGLLAVVAAVFFGAVFLVKHGRLKWLLKLVMKIGPVRRWMMRTAAHQTLGGGAQGEALASALEKIGPVALADPMRAQQAISRLNRQEQAAVQEMFKQMDPTDLDDLNLSREQKRAAARKAGRGSASATAARPVTARPGKKKTTKKKKKR